MAIRFRVWPKKSPGLRRRPHGRSLWLPARGQKTTTKTAVGFHFRDVPADSHGCGGRGFVRRYLHTQPPPGEGPQLQKEKSCEMIALYSFRSLKSSDNSRQRI